MGEDFNDDDYHGTDFQSMQAPSSTHPATTYPVRTNPSLLCIHIYIHIIYTIFIYVLHVLYIYIYIHGFEITYKGTCGILHISLVVFGSHPSILPDVFFPELSLGRQSCTNWDTIGRSTFQPTKDNDTHYPRSRCTDPLARTSV